MKRCIAAVVLALVALPGSALAADDMRSEQAVTGGSLGVAPPTNAQGTDVAAADQQAPPSTAAPVNAKGTDVAAVDQQASTSGSAPSTATASDDGGFDWTDAGIGAVGTASLLAVSLGGALMLRRRHTHAQAA